MRDHTKLRAFKLVDEVAILIYQATRNFPKDELYGLTSQIRRAAVSAASNIVEGSARESEVEYVRFLEIAYASLKEAGYQLGLAQRLGYLEEKIFLPCYAAVMEAEKVLCALIKSMRSKSTFLQPTAHSL
ncbi:MAG: four helix bundle protein [Chthoniobacterales bacterium]|nr:four helix bundle protein [Chthoniobacterales bacterium]